MGRVALGTLHRKAGHRDCLAPQRIPPVLDMEGPARAARAPINLQGDPETGSEDEPRQKWTNGRSSGTQSQPADAEEVVRLREAGRLAREARLAAHRGLE